MNHTNLDASGAAFLVAVALTPLVMRVCFRFNVLDQPGPLKIHTRPIPRLGGIAIAVAIAAGMLVAGDATAGHLLLVTAFALVWFTGLLDDLRGLPPVTRLTAQILAAFLIYRAGFGFPFESGVLSLVGTAVVVVLYVNALNMWDGSDGLATGCAGLAVLAFFFAPHQSHGAASALACSTAAAAAGFLVFNLKGAAFMGDSGSTLLGLILAFLSLDFYRANRVTLPVATYPVFLVALPILDSGLAIIRRLRNARSPALGDRSHLYDLMLAHGSSARSVAFTSFAITSALAVLGWLALRTRGAGFVILGGLVLVALLALGIRFGALRVAQLRVSSLPTFHEEAETPPAWRE